MQFFFDENEKNEKNLNYTKKSEIIAIKQENLEELLIAFAIENTKYLKKLQY